ncbi:protein-methionine-sulfoxide reductase heme-binding subunit MsrQ [Celerinatantimonas diazotrophica]|uniref:Protein-methionine-sulfoxide reductase heme-binding subunit MsrQ n=1 Tax=Celerinatantimonas diazotrophica TaxID=412034 RepID=A0A4R1J939_9GAMM|nr:protein-methionine-sulfoxide reductase heme-binding subunit MsrQ [Celerinatantimonas diazotrophica]TCK46904.1 sulfoxide reductase heme-binding subunit YedZ [Celerinatantimonas diazotrophica]CAG9295671.1 Protein-methionine-sulfoxide reductase heme-binding subunit MsrQ [Celerinatantimonas diazotrophica]
MPVRLRRWTIFVVALIPFAQLVYGAVYQTLGGDPAKAILLATGFWAMRFLLITLAVSPLVRYLKWRWLMPHRRMLGLFALFYGLAHLLSYYQFILGGNLAMLGEEIIKRPYILVGMPALLILIALGITSTRGWMRRLGRRWQQLHQLIYLAFILAWVHLYWQVRSSYFDAVLYGAIGLVLLSFRVRKFLIKRT